jgi:exodeoxyribonuclease VII large subunit
VSATEQNPPTLASLRAGRGRVRSERTSSASADLHQGSLLFAATEPESTPPLVNAAESAPKIPDPIPDRQILTVAALVGKIRQQVETTHIDIWVEGEISNCRPAPSGHIYLTLKDDVAQLPVVLFRRQAQLLRFRPEDGLAVLVRGRVSVYESRGQLQLIAETMEPRGAGSLQIAFEQLKARLMAEGLFDASRKRPLPAFPRCVGVITSPTGAVIRDIVTVVRRRHAALSLLVHPAVMQGATSPSSVARAIRWFNANSQHVDLIVIARGGGSLEDLSCFNDEALARIIVASKLPVVSAIGHETDFTIADFVADLRAPTPSAAAELITSEQHRVEERITLLDLRVRRAIRLHLLEARQRYSRLSAPAVLARVSAAIDRRSQRVDELTLRLERAMQRNHRQRELRLRHLAERLRRQNIALRFTAMHRQLERLTQRLERAAGSATAQPRMRLGSATTRLQALSPLSVLARGYALVYNADGTLLRSAERTAPGQTIRARLTSGSLSAQVTAIDPPSDASNNTLENRNR